MHDVERLSLWQRYRHSAGRTVAPWVGKPKIPPLSKKQIPAVACEQSRRQNYNNGDNTLGVWAIMPNVAKW